MQIKLIKKPTPISEIALLAKEQFGDMIKAVVDIERELIAAGGELHSDEEAILLEDGSKQEYLWGINIYPDKSLPDQIEFDSMINIRPSLNNRSRGVEDPEIQSRILLVVKKLIAPQ